MKPRPIMPLIPAGCRSSALSAVVRSTIRISPACGYSEPASNSRRQYDAEINRGVVTGGDWLPGNAEDGQRTGGLDAAGNDGRGSDAGRHSGARSSLSSGG